MKNFLKGFLLLTFLLTSLNLANHNFTVLLIEKVISSVIKQEPEKVNIYSVTATMYYPTASQCDSSPDITAGHYKIPENATEQNWIAVSRDLLAKCGGGGEFEYGDLVQIKGTKHKDGIYRIVDTMNKRFTNRIDFLETNGTKPYKFNNVTLTKWNTKTQTENVLASL